MSSFCFIFDIKIVLMWFAYRL